MADPNLSAASDGVLSLKEEVRGAVARGWCSKRNEHKEMDVDLADSIFAEVWAEVAAHVHTFPDAQSAQVPVAWTNEAQLGFLKNPDYALIPMAMWAERADKYADIPLYASQPSPAATVETEAVKTCNSYLERALDAEADALRLHREKMEMYERAIVAEAKLASHNSSSAATEHATGRYEFPYNRTFQAIAAATSVYAEGVGVNVSVKAFQEAFNSFPDARPLNEPQAVSMSRDDAESLVFDLLDAARDLDRAETGLRKNAREYYAEMRDKVMDALTSQVTRPVLGGDQ